MLGLFDSGLGGLTVLRRLVEQMPHEDLVFFADQAHAPYGQRQSGDLVGLMHANLAWLDNYGVDGIVMACNTSCAMAEQYGWPPLSVPVLDLIESAAIAIERARVERVAVIATTATARSGSYGRQIVSRMPTAHVVEIGAPALVPLVEAGLLDGKQPRAAVREVCALLPRDLDAVVLACTHYPLLDRHFAEFLGPDVLRIDPACVQAERAAGLIGRRTRGSGAGTVECFTNGDLGRFTANLDRLIPDLSPRALSRDDFEGFRRPRDLKEPPNDGRHVEQPKTS